MKKYFLLIAITLLSTATTTNAQDFLENLDFYLKKRSDLIDTLTKTLDNEKSKRGESLREQSIKSKVEVTDEDRILVGASLENLSQVIYLNCITVTFKRLEQLGKEIVQIKEVGGDYLNTLNEYCETKILSDKSIIKKYLSSELTIQKAQDAIMANGELISFEEKARADFLENLDDIKIGRIPRKTSVARKREAAKKDEISQALNYAYGTTEDSSGYIFFSRKSGLENTCTYEMVIDSSDRRGALLKSNTKIPIFIDLSKANLKNMSFYEIKGREKAALGKLNAYLRYQSKTDGLPDLFECDSNTCNIARLKRAWALIESKCTGASKAF